MKLFFIILSVFALSFNKSYQVYNITYTVTNKVQHTFDSVKDAEHDPWIDSIVLSMVNKTRIIHEFNLRSAQGETHISKYRFISSGSIQVTGSLGPYTYKNDQWFTENLLEDPKMYTVTNKETGEKKNILGYECTKFVSKRNTTDSMKIEIWATRRMPSYINPVFQLTGFPYGILEVIIGDSNEVIQAKSIRIDEPNKNKKIRTETI